MKIIRIRNIAVALLVTTAIASCSTIKKLENRPIGLINDVTYKNTSFDNPNACNGFIVQYNNRDYAITAKHVLMIAKTDNMKFVDFEGQLQQWRMYPKNDSTSYINLDKLLSVNKKDSLTWSYMNDNWETYNDWLVFSIKENKSNHKPLKFRTQPLKKGDKLYAVGWSYKDTIGTQRVYEYKYDTTDGIYHNLIQVKGSKNLGGLSGSPVVDKRGDVVGLVSSGGEDEKTKQVLLQATTIKNAIEFISKLD